MDSLGNLRKRLGAIVIGASAGGIEVLSTVLPALRPTLAVPVFIVIHLPREGISHLASIFRHKCTLAVKEAEDKEPPLAGTVYFAPPNYHLLIESGPVLALSCDDLVHFSRPSIDVLFESAADAYGERLLGVVLSGANEDGASGLAAVSQAGGVAMVQDPDSAHVSTMPAAAWRRSRADWVLKPSAMADFFAKLSE